MISVIIPIFNSESYLHHCLDSILNQSFRDLEIILVDDGSTDSSGTLCDDYARKDCRCHVIHQENKGQWAARNTGLDAATGEFVFFIDSDDYCHQDTLKLMYATLDSHPECDCAVGHLRATQDYEIMAPQLASSYQVKTQAELLEHFFSYPGGILTMMWNKLYRKDFIRDLKVNRYMRAEDYDFNLRAYLLLNAAAILDAETYYWVQRAGSLSHTADSRSIHLDCVMKIDTDNFFSLSEDKRSYGHYLLDHLFNTLSNDLNATASISSASSIARKGREYCLPVIKDYFFCQGIPLRRKLYNIARLLFPATTFAIRSLRHLVIVK